MIARLVTDKGETMLGQLRRGSDADSGSAIILTMLMLAVLSGLSLTVFTLSSDNLGNARRDRQAASALANSEAGVSQAISYLKSRGVGALACAPNCGTANSWGEEPDEVDGDAAPSMEVSFGPTETYKVWIETVQQLSAVTETPGIYKVHSIGNAGVGPGSRRVEVEVQVAPFEFPLAVVADSVQAGGDGAIHTESLFSTGCIFKRDKIAFQGIDPVYGIPAAAHSAQYITNSQTGGASCAATDPKNIHKPVGERRSRAIRPFPTTRTARAATSVVPRATGCMPARTPKPVTSQMPTTLRRSSTSNWRA